MRDFKQFFKGKKITVMGLGLLGRGIGDAAFLAEQGAELIVTDLRSENELNESVKKLIKYHNITFVLGKHRLEDFRDRDFILKAAGVPLNSLYITEARKNNIPIEMSTALFADLSGAYTIGVTGTRGKSTVVHLLYEILKHAGRRVHLGGNVKGISTLAQLPNIKEGDCVVLELDSWQLQGFGERKISPHMAIFTNFLPDHMNYYKNDMEDYFDDKANIFKYQKKGDYLVLGKQVVEHFLNVRHRVSDIEEKTVSIVDRKNIPKNWKLKIPGEHNRNNVALAVEVARILNIEERNIKSSVENFPGVPGRLEFLREINGVKIYNDTTATTPDATIAALWALASQPSSEKNQNKKIILILGGADKVLDMRELIKEMPKYCKKVLLLPGTGTKKLKFKNKDLKFKNVENLEEAVELAMDEAKKGDIVLFSPAFASFGLFKHEFDRGQQFCDLVKKLT